MSNLSQSASRGAVWHGAAQLCLTASGYIVAVILARTLGPIDFGTYGVVYSLLMALELTVLIGIPGAIVRLIAEREADSRALAASAVTMVASCCLVAFSILWILAPIIAAALHLPDGARLLRVAFIDLPFFGLYHVIGHVLNGKRDFRAQSVATILYALVKVLGMLVLNAVGVTIEGALIVNILASIAGLAVVQRVAGAHVLIPTLSRAAPILKLAGPVALIAVGAQLLLYVDLWAIGALISGESDDKGYYVAAKNLARIPNLVSFVLMAVLVPSIGRARALGDSAVVLQLTRGTTRFLAVTLLPGCALMALEAAPLMSLMFSATYVPGAPYLALLVTANGLLHTLLTTYIAILIAVERQRLGAMLAVAAVVPGALLSILLVSRLGAIGAAYAALISTALAAAAAAYAVYQAAGGLSDPWVLPKALFTTGLVCVAAALLPAQGLLLVIELAALMLIALAINAALGVVSRADLKPFQGAHGAADQSL